jgi:hypothetical protein
MCEARLFVFVGEPLGTGFFAWLVDPEMHSIHANNENISAVIKAAPNNLQRQRTNVGNSFEMLVEDVVCCSLAFAPLSARIAATYFHHLPLPVFSFIPFHAPDISSSVLQLMSQFMAMKKTMRSGLIRDPTIVVVCKSENKAEQVSGLAPWCPLKRCSLVFTLNWRGPPNPANLRPTARKSSGASCINTMTESYAIQGRCSLLSFLGSDITTAV